MALRRLLAIVIFWPEVLRGAHVGDVAPHPCFASEAVPPNERRFFTFAPANVRSDPPVHCVFVFGGPPGYLLRLGLYDVRTKGPRSFLGQESARLCGSDVIRVYDVGRQGLQLKAAYCGLFRRGKMLSMSSNMAVVTYTSDSNDPVNAFNLGVDAIDAGREVTTRKTTVAPCRETSTVSSSPTTVTTTSTTVTTTPAVVTFAGGGSDDDTEEETTAVWIHEEDGGGDWGGASGDSEESGEQGEAWYHDNDAVVVGVISTGGDAGTPPEGGGGPVVGAAVETRKTEAPSPAGWAMRDAGGLEGEETEKVVAVYSNGTGDEDEDGLAFYYFM